MKKIKKHISVLLAIVILFSFAGCTSGSEKRELAVIPDINSPADIIYVINRSVLNNDEYAMATSLQGLCAKQNAKIYIEDGSNYVFLDSYLEENDGIEVKRTDDVWELLNLNRDAVTDNGCVVYESESSSINLAFTVSGMERWLAVASSLAAAAVKMGFEIKQDFTQNTDSDNKAAQENLFEKYKDRLNKNIIIHQSPELVTLRDYAVAAGAFCFYTDENDRSQKKFREKVFAWANENALVFGWSADEIGYVKSASKSAAAVIPSDHCSNLSMLSSLTLKESLHQKNQPEQISAQEDKHYIALVMSDGDNLQWYETTIPFRDHYYDRVTSPENYKLTWTAPPLMYKLAPTVLQYVYDIASDKDRFICGVSGMGYINPTKYSESSLDSFAGASADAMQQADLQTLTILDSCKNTDKLAKALEPYAQCDSVSGGLMQINEKYEALSGKSITVNGKPFISARKSFWFTSGNENEKISKQWIENFAKEINALPCDVNSTAGYSYINIHPWSVSVEDINYLVSLLDEHIEIVYADELIELVCENVKQQ